MSTELVRVGPIEDFKSGEGKTVEAGGRQIAIFRLGDGLYALDDLCSHMGGPLGEGDVANGCVTCPWHRARFDIASGRVESPPAGADVAQFPVKVENGVVFVQLGA